jgi:hypothetical protein
LEQLDWLFTSANWISVYPNSVVLPLAHTKSDHIPYVVNIDTTIPKARIFWFENFWIDQPGFINCMKNSWSMDSRKKHCSAIIADKFKCLRYALKKWQMSISKLKLLIQKCNRVILILDTLEENRNLFTSEFNFKNIVKQHLEDLLLIECNYWRKRCTIRWIKMSEDNTKFFHAMATQRMRRNAISMLKANDGRIISDHDEMAGLLWSEYRDRMGKSEVFKCSLISAG